MSRLKARAERKWQEEQQAVPEGFWPELCRRIEAGQVIPIISNSVANDRIFDMDNDGLLGIGNDEKSGWSIEEQLADAWATEVGYPLGEQPWLPRVALYDRVVNSSDDRAAKTRYLNWLKDSLLYLAEDDPSVNRDHLEDLRDELESYSFADIATNLGYPRPLPDITNPLQLLAQLKLPIYITTSYHDFLERAILDNGRQPRTQICFWADEPVNYVDESHKTSYDLIPTPENPLVYHIYGLENYPESMVLNEDDYLDFLSVLSRDIDQERPILPNYLRKALTQSSLILLGYHLRNWDMRVLFRGLINTTPTVLRMFNLAIQLDPASQNSVISADQVRAYLEKYFSTSNFTVEWGQTHSFIEQMWKEAKQWRQ